MQAIQFGPSLNDGHSSGSHGIIDATFGKHLSNRSREPPRQHDRHEAIVLFEVQFGVDPCCHIYLFPPAAICRKVMGAPLTASMLAAALAATLTPNTFAATSL